MDAVAVAPGGDVVVLGPVNDLIGELTVLRLESTGKPRWRRDVHGSLDRPGVREPLGIDPAGDVVVGGGLVAKLDGDSGATLWETPLPSSPAGAMLDAQAIAIGPGGDVVAGGPLHVGADFRIVVLKLDGATGTPQWGRVFNGPGFRDDLNGLAVDAAGDIVVLASLDDLGTNYDTFVVKLAGADGSTLWSHLEADPVQTFAWALALDSSGDVVAGDDARVLKLDGATGAEIWRAEPHPAFALAIDPGGDVFTAREHVFRLDGGTGAQLWQQMSPGTTIRALARGGADDRLVVGGLSVAPATLQARALVVAELSAATGEQVWFAAARGTAISSGSARDLALDSAGRPVAGGFVTDVFPYAFLGSEDHFTALKLSDRLAGKKLVVTDPPGDPTKRRLRVISRDPLVAAPLPVSPADPSVDGGALELVNTMSGERLVLPLPATNWEVKGDSLRGSTKSKYVYKDSGLVAGPCKSVLMQNGKKLTIACQGTALGFDLAAAAGSGSLGLILRIGSMRHCLLFGGTLRVTAGGGISATDAPPPLTCPGA